MTEKQLEHLILQYLPAISIYAWKNNSVGVWDASRKQYRKPNSPYLIKGVSDILGILKDGRFLAIEVKRPVKKPRTDERLRAMASSDQLLFIDRINESGGIAFLADSLDTVKNTLSPILSHPCL